MPKPLSAHPLYPREAEILRGVIALFADPARHTTGNAARDAKQRPVLTSDKKAVCFCFIGGLIKVDRDKGGIGVPSEVEEAILETFKHLREEGRAAGDASLIAVNEKGSSIVDETGERRIGREAVIELCNRTLERHAVA